jgi:hypothetical protein
LVNRNHVRALGLALLLALVICLIFGVLLQLPKPGRILAFCNLIAIGLASCAGSILA